MQTRLVARVSQWLRALIRGDDWEATAPETDIATLGLMARVRDESQSRRGSHAEPAFALPQLLRSLHPREADASSRDRHGLGRRAASDLPGERVDRDGTLRPLDDEFFARRRYDVRDLTGFVDAVFVEVAYRCVLKRAADPAGASAFLRSLHDGTRDRVDILYGLSTSPEGRRQRVAIEGLARAAVWRRAGRVRYVGLVVRWLHAVASADRISRRLQVVEAPAGADRQRRASEPAPDEPDLRRIVESLEQPQAQIKRAVVELADRDSRFRLEAPLRDAAGEPHDPRDDAGFASVPPARLEREVREQRATLDATAASLEHGRGPPT